MDKISFTRIRQIAVVLLIVVGTLFSCTKGDYEADKNLTFAFYNVENLFDLKDEPGKSDEEFTPQSEKEWNQERYDKKLADLSDVLGSINKSELPEVIGLCEVENKKVIKDLAKTGKLSGGKYKTVHFESPDKRGIDCALIYRGNEFKVIEKKAIKIKFKKEPNYTTRDILYVKGETNNKEQFHVFINHWPSRVEGLKKTEPRRVEVARQLKGVIDSILEKDKNANIVVMGDMNDEPTNKSLSSILGAFSPNEENANLVNLMFPDDKENDGSYNFRGNWNMLDNIIVSKSLLDSTGYECVDRKGHVFHKEWMEYINREGQMTPNRTYGGPNYYGGISDHFPVYFKLTL